MGLIVVDKDDDQIEAVTFENLDVDNDLTIIIDFKEVDKESISVYMTLSQVESLKRHVDSELEKLENLEQDEKVEYYFGKEKVREM